MKNFMILAACAATFYACSSNDVNTPDINENTTGLLSVSTSVLTQNSKGTKAPVTGTQLPTGAKIGVFVFNDNTEVAYDGSNINATGSALNQKWTAGETAGKQTWSASPFTLSIKHADVFAYYPFNDANQSYNAIPVQAGYTDYLVGGHDVASHVNGAQPAATIKLDHALSMISFTFKKGTSYPDACELQKIHFPGLNQAATINVKTKAFSAYTGTGDFVVLKHNGGDDYSTITSDAISTEGIGNNKEYHALLLPQTGTDTKNVIVRIDNIDYTVSLAHTATEGNTSDVWASGRHYTYNLTLNGGSGQGNQLIVSSVTVSNWVDGGSSDIPL